MRKRIEQGGVVVQAIAGNHAVFLGFDLAAKVRAGCLGFALHRDDHTESEAYWIPGFKTFRSVIPEPSATTIYTTDKHPIQAMWWGDYSANPRTTTATRSSPSTEPPRARYWMMPSQSPSM